VVRLFFGKSGQTFFCKSGQTEAWNRATTHRGEFGTWPRGAPGGGARSSRQRGPGDGGHLTVVDSASVGLDSAAACVNRLAA
jgi:hypothetical protein